MQDTSFKLTTQNIFQASSNNLSNVKIELQEINESYEDYFDPRLPRWIALVIFVIGIFGNLISILVFFQKKMKKNSTFIYLAFLCIVDLFVILFGLGDILVISYFRIIIRNQSSLLCRFHTFFIYASTHLSSFILASVSVDRAIATNCLNFAKVYCTPKYAYRILIVNCLISVLINFHSLIFLGYEKQLNSSIHSIPANSESSSEPKYFCGTQNGTIYDTFLDPYFQWIDLIFYAIAPFIIMATATILILRVIIMSNKRINRSSTQKASVIVQKKSRKQNGSKSSMNGIAKRDHIKFSFKTLSTRSEIFSNPRFNKTLNLTYTLISINALFFLLVSPLAISGIIIKGKQSVQYHKIFYNIVYLLAYSSHSFNFIFYGLSSPPYRQSLKRLLKLG